MYNEIITADTSKSHKSNHIKIDMSFTYLHWKIAEVLQKKSQKDFELSKMTGPEIKDLVLNIFPHGNTFLHYIFEDMNQLKLLYKEVRNDELNKSVTTVPFIRNFDKISPIHMTLKSHNYQAL